MNEIVELNREEALERWPQRIQPLDFVRTPKGAIAMVTEVGERGDASIKYLGGGNPTGEKNAWWHPKDGLVIVDSLPHLLAGCTPHPLGSAAMTQADEFFPIAR